MMEKLEHLTDLTLYAPNLVSKNMWSELFVSIGHKLKSLKLKWMDDTFQDSEVERLVQHCPNLVRLKLCELPHLGSESILALCDLRKLEHLSLDFQKGVDNEHLTKLITSVGAKLQTLSLRNFPDIDDTVLDAIRATCRSLTKLRVTPCHAATDAAWAALFAPGWRNPPLRRLHLSAARDVDNQRPDGPADAPVGIAAAAFPAIIRHSARGLERLELASCRHVPAAALLGAFAPDALPAELDPETGEDRVPAPPVLLPKLRVADLSFVANVDDVALAGLFRAAPLLERVTLFGCFGVTSDVAVPRGVVVIGAPCLETEGMEMYGEAERAVVDGDAEMQGDEMDVTTDFVAA
jgi:DNA repair protein RAD7